ncbi:hypothetical protein M408DRAFT_317392 [Serendipita vermifera MAFF 305830]|uniref:Uncharacterized protein n=1 Tax=Serendipita vermifera MAFF 305830 TaxID=933852 RepID=A0A0C2WDV5_SERVB|nr:hypothetical protein M408DRAFT_317392 [Serendipita vermifera MAFF 305830]
MSLSAVGKTPTEIWASILSLLLRTPLLPRDDVTIAESLAVFSNGCDADRLYRDLCRISVSLRLVCSSWDRLVQRIHPTVVIANLNTNYVEELPAHVLPALSMEGKSRPELLKAQRLAIWTPFECSCGQECRSGLPSHTADPLRRMKKPTGLLNPFDPAQDLSRLEVFIFGSYGGLKSPVPLLDRAPNLRVLSWAVEWRDAYFEPPIHHRVHNNLTHLKISLRWDHIYSLKSPIPFHNLRFLHLSISDRISGEEYVATLRKPNDLGLENWAEFPILQRLHLSLCVDELQQRKDDLVAFLTAVGTNLSSLIYNVSYDRSIWFEPEFWDLFPSLVEFGLYDHLILTRWELSPPPKTMKPLNLIYQFSDYAHPSVDETPDNTVLDQFISLCKRWRTEKMTILQPWRDAEIMMAEPIDDRSEYEIGTHVEFYERLVALGVVISDRDGVSIREPAGQRFLEALKEYEPKRLAEEQRRRESWEYLMAECGDEEGDENGEDEDELVRIFMGD